MAKLILLVRHPHGQPWAGFMSDPGKSSKVEIVACPGGGLELKMFGFHGNQIWLPPGHTLEVEWDATFQTGCTGNDDCPDCPGL